MRNYLVLLGRITVIVACLSLTLYVSVLAYMLGVWFVDDSVGPRMSTADWALTALYRVALFSAIGIILGLFIYVVLRLAFGWRADGTARNIPLILAVSSLMIVSVTSIIAGIQFFLEKPWF